ncbi:hypothetical protein [Streptomyces griseomycini]|uniref:Uncharacterized protein n=1 Tax=Streptomyces griseomycini TaxID=66895 RepID=A0A7W7LW07_9ACTN|nr:hypothetical protein [Streptomyces griseomycini]MBB4897504.1 hypothetical protein [Streptomyces griseomycini]
MTWSEAEYLEYLESERRAFAWVMRRYGGLTPAKAWEEALECYPYEPAGHPCRGLVFHDEAWHWAMLTIHGDWYVVEHPELVGPPAEYEALR